MNENKTTESDRIIWQILTVLEHFWISKIIETTNEIYDSDEILEDFIRYVAVLTSMWTGYYHCKH